MRAETVRLLKAPGKARCMDVVDLLVWVYRDQKADRVDGRGIGLFEGERVADAADRGRVALPGAGRTMTAVVGEIATVGCRIDRIGYDTGQLHPIAERVNELVERIGAPASGLLVHYGRRAEYPPAYDLRVELTPAWRGRPKYRQDGKPDERHVLRIYDKTRNAIGCRLELRPQNSMIGDLQQDYRLWYGGLLAVVDRWRQLADRAGRLFVTGPIVPAEPWLRTAPPAGSSGHVIEGLDNTKKP